MRSSRGQATPEYVAIVLVVAVVLGTAAALTSGGLGGTLLNGARRGLCAVSGHACAPLPVAGDLPPCPLRAEENVNDLRVGAGWVDLGRDRGLRIERFSDGHVEVTFSSGGAAGLQAQLGVIERAGSTDVTLGASIGIRLHLGSGRTWRFASRRAADAFVRRWAGRQRIAGGLLHDVHSLCLLCRLVGKGPRAMPPADVTWHAHGDVIDGSASLRTLGLGTSVEATMEQEELGERVERTGGRTRFLALTDHLAAAFAGQRTIRRAGGGTLALELHQDRRGRPDELVLRSVRRAGGDAAEAIHEDEWRLPVRSGADLAAVRSLLRGYGPRSELSVLLAVRPFLARLERAGTHTARVVRAREHDGGTGFLLHGTGAAVDDRGRDETLVSEQVALPGLRALPRGDCVA